jgi:hypothetical protein
MTDVVARLVKQVEGLKSKDKDKGFTDSGAKLERFAELCQAFARTGSLT